MNKKEYVKFLILFELEMNKLLYGYVSEINTEFNIPPVLIEKYLETLGWTNKDFDRNGFQWDWWLTLEKNNKIIKARGCGYWGGTSMTLEKIKYTLSKL